MSYQENGEEILRPLRPAERRLSERYDNGSEVPHYELARMEDDGCPNYREA